ncbi:aspartate kinase [Oceanihabitans sp. IOP_32]|nr:aspartate kinase [Oceanihabitans sp. IOP_32]
MKVLKFGGTSVGSIENMSNVKTIINDGHKKIVVLSAMSGTTNQLVAISNYIKDEKRDAAMVEIHQLYDSYIPVIDGLLTDKNLNTEVKHYVSDIFSFIIQATNKTFSKTLENEVLAQGELLSTFIFNAYLTQEGIRSVVLPALDFMRIDAAKEPDLPYIKRRFQNVFNASEASDVYITQGFVCLDADAKISNLQRGGSDYTATIIAAVIRAEEVQIWTDIDGMHNNDPRIIENTKPISNLSYDEAAELAYFGAKILHPQTVTPVRAHNIPIRLKNTLNPQALGTLISYQTSENGVKAMAVKDGITAIKIKSDRMLLAHGFLRKIFEVFELYETAIDMITTSEVAVSLTIDDAKNLEYIIAELQKFAVIEVDENQSIVCLVGHEVANHQDTFKLFHILKDVKIRMISYGGSNNNISLLINTNDKIKTLKKLNTYVFDWVGV